MSLTMAGATLAGSILAASGATAGSISAAKANKRGARTAKQINEQNIAYQREQNDLNYQRAIEAWHMENDYNSPKAQMERYQEAGLNPNLIYSQSNESGSIGVPAGEAPKMTMDEATIAQNSATNFAALGQAAGATLNSYQQGRLVDEQLRQIKLNNDSKEVANEYQRGFYDLDKRQRIANVVSTEYNNRKQTFLEKCGQWQLEINALQGSILNQVEQLRGMRLSNTQKKQQIKLFEDTYQNQLKLLSEQVISEQLKNTLARQNISINSLEAAWKAPLGKLINAFARQISDGDIQGAAEYLTNKLNELVSDWNDPKPGVIKRGLQWLADDYENSVNVYKNAWNRYNNFMWSIQNAITDKISHIWKHGLTFNDN